MKMSIEEVRNWLEQYIPYKGKIEFIKTRLDWLREEKELIENMGVSLDEVIEGAALSSQKFSDIPPSNTNEIRSKTEDVASTYKASVDRELKDLTQCLERLGGEIEHYEDCLPELEYRVKVVSGWFKQLKNKEQYYIIDLLYQQREKMEEVKLQYYNEYILRDMKEFKIFPKTDSEKIYKAVQRVRSEAFRIIAEFTEIKKLP